jgi:mercuric ion binding protein
MKKLITPFALATFALSAFASMTVWAAPQTVNLSVPGMTCSTCPITVKKALAKVDGVTKAEVHFENRSATVTFDDARTNVKALIQATTNAGYPSQLVK